MEERKLIRLGNSSFAIALPKDWVDKAGLKKGDKVFVVPDSNGRLFIEANFQGNKEAPALELNVENKEPDFIKKYLHAAYINGYDKMHFKGSKEFRKTIKDLVKNYVSLEIVDSNEKEDVVKDFFDMQESKYESFVKRIDNNLREMFEVILNELQKKKIDDSVIKEIKEIDKSVNKFYFLCSRLFIKGIDNPALLSTLKMDGSSLFNNWWIAFNHEAIGDGLKSVAQNANSLDIKDKKALLEILDKLSKAHLESMEAFYNNEHEKAHGIISHTLKIREDIDKLGSQNHKALKMAHALEIIERNIYQNAKMIFHMNV